MSKYLAYIYGRSTLLYVWILEAADRLQWQYLTWFELLTLKALSKIVADDILFFSEKIGPKISCKRFACQMIRMKW